MSLFYVYSLPLITYHSVSLYRLFCRDRLSGVGGVSSTAGSSYVPPFSTYAKPGFRPVSTNGVNTTAATNGNGVNGYHDTVPDR